MSAEHQRISVIITSYNQRDYLREAIESVLAQTLPCFEILVADDCSSDGSQELIAEYQRRYAGLIQGHCHPNNLGIPLNRNYALERARGNWVAILDGDDRFAPEKNEREMRARQEHPGARIIYSNVRMIDSSGAPLKVRDRVPQPAGMIFKDVFAGKLGLLRSMIIQAAALAETGFMDPAFWNYDGYDLCVRLARRYEFAYIPEPLVEYRVHLRGTSRDLDPAVMLAQLRGIYEKNRPLLAGVPDSDAHFVEQQWVARLARLEAQLGLQSGLTWQSLRLYLHFLKVNAASAAGLRSSVRLALPLLANGLRRTAMADRPRR